MPRWKNKEERFYNLIEPQGECLVFTGRNNTGKGYGVFCKMLVHRYAYTLYYGPIPEGLDVLHTCDVRRCCRKEHLYPGTNTDNTHDMVIRGRTLQGELQPTSKFTSDEVVGIRKAYESGQRVSVLAKRNHVDRGTISDIVHRYTYRNVE